MPVETPFSSVDEAIAAFEGGGGYPEDNTQQPGPGDDGAGDDGQPGDDGDGSGWGEPEAVDELQGGWTLVVQRQTEGSSTRWFVVGGPENGYLNQSGNVEVPDGNEQFGDMPSFDTEDDARSAHQAWLDEHGDGEPGDGEDDDGDEGEDEDGWTDWRELERVGDWYIFAREKQDGSENAEFLVSGENAAGEVVYLQPDGSASTSRHVYETVEDVQAALEAYFQKEADGDVPDDQRPTGAKPDKAAINDGDGGGGSGGGVGSLLTSRPVVALVALIVVYYVYQQYGGDL